MSPASPQRTDIGIGRVLADAAADTYEKNRMSVRSVRERIRPHLDVYGARLGALAAFLQPRRAVPVRAPQAAALPAGIRIIDSPVQSLGKKAQWVWDAQHDHLAVL